MEQEVLHRYHNDFGHFGVENNYLVLLENYWFPETKAKIRSHIKNCIKCIAYTKNVGRSQEYLHSIPKKNLPFMTIHIDHYGPIDRSHASKNIYYI